MNPLKPVFSPLEPIFADQEHAIPFAFSEQFLHADGYPYSLKLVGKMHEIWHKPRWLSPLFQLLGKLGILVPHTAKEIPTTLTVVPGRYTSGQIFHRWERTMQFETPVRFNTTIIYDENLNQVVDLVGPFDLLYMVWKAKFKAPDTFTLDTAACAFHIAGRLLWMPRWLWKLLLGTVRFVQKVDPQKNDTVHIDLRIIHPLFGEIFGYTGIFATVRSEKSEQTGQLQ